MTDTVPNGDFVLTDHDWRSRASCGWDVSKLSIGWDLVVWHQLILRQMSDDVIVWKRSFQTCQVVHLNFGSLFLVWFLFDAVQWCLVLFLLLCLVLRLSSAKEELRSGNQVFEQSVLTDRSTWRDLGGPCGTDCVNLPRRSPKNQILMHRDIRNWSQLRQRVLCFMMFYAYLDMIMIVYWTPGLVLAVVCHYIIDYIDTSFPRSGGACFMSWNRMLVGMPGCFPSC